MNVRLRQSIIDNHILLLEINNPPANSLSKSVKIEFMQVLDQLEQANDFRAIIITGTGNKFCTGDDLKEAIVNSKKEGAILENLKKFSQIIDRIEALPIPTIAAINGWCTGGGLELALCCDIRVASYNAQFITSGVNVGLTASGYRLPRIIGIGRAKRMLLSGESILASTALNYGLITDVYNKEEIIEESIGLAKQIAAKAPLAIQATKRIANMSFNCFGEEAYSIQQLELEALSITADHKEALQAFSEKRKPIFHGK